MILFDTSVIIDTRDLASELVTRDPARVSTYFPNVELVQP